MSGPNGHSREPSACTDATDKHAADNDLQVSVRKLAVVATDLEDVAMHEVSACPKESRGGSSYGGGWGRDCWANGPRKLSVGHIGP